MNGTGNPDNSSVIQCLLDLEKAMAVSDNPNASDVLKAVKTIKDKLSEDDIVHTDGIFNAHRYGDKNLVFTKLSRFRENQTVAGLSSAACKILLYAVQIMSEDNCFLARQNNMVKVLGMANKTVIKALKELTDMGCIIKVCTLKQKKPSGTVYMVRSDIARIGNKSNEYFVKQMTSRLQYNEYESLKKPCYNVIHASVRLEDRTISFNYDDIVSEKH